MLGAKRVRVVRGCSACSPILDLRAVLQDYHQITLDQIEQVEKQTLRVIVQALQEYSREARDIFENTPAPSEAEIIVLAEDLVQYALEVAECYPINKRFAGFIDYKRVRWISTPFGLFPQVLLVDAKASTENNRETLQQSQLAIDADFTSKGVAVRMRAGVPPHMEVVMADASIVPAITTSAFIHFYYEDMARTNAPYRRLRSIFAMLLPHQSLKPRYNPDATTTFFGQGKHSPARLEVPRIRVYFGRLRAMSPWRLQELQYVEGQQYATPLWRDVDNRSGTETHLPFRFIGRSHV
jgi:hypothetical protein